MVIVRADGNIGPFRSIVRDDSRNVLVCDAAEFFIDGLGEYSISEDDSLAPAPTPFSPPADRVREDIIQKVQARLDDFAKTKGYDGILSACTYATDPNPIFSAEGIYCVNQRSATWAKCYEILTEVQIGVRPMPSGYADIEAELPALTWL